MHYQRSLAVKSVFAQLIYTIMVPIFVNYYIKSNLYDKNGLADDNYNIALTNSYLNPLFKFFDLAYLWTNSRRLISTQPCKAYFIDRI